MISFTKYHFCAASGNKQLNDAVICKVQMTETLYKGSN
jgi:hypothetical protein